MEKFDYLTVYCNGRPYNGPPTVVKGTKICPHCKSNMNIKPYGQQYVNKDGGYILVNISPTTGRMTLSQAKADLSWCCEKCLMTLRYTK